MRKYLLDDANARDDGLVCLQTQEEPYGQEQKGDEKQAQQKGSAPLCPEERILLHILWREELVGMNGVHIDGNDLQRQLIALVCLAAHFHFDRRNRIEMLIEAGNGESLAKRSQPIAGINSIGINGQQLDARHKIGQRTPIGEFHLRALLGRYSNGHVGLLTNEDAIDGIERLLNLYALSPTSDDGEHGKGRDEC